MAKTTTPKTKPAADAKPKVKKPAAPKPKPKKPVKPDTQVSGTLEIGSHFNLSNGKPAPDGKYKMGGHSYHVSKGIITEINDVQ